MNGFSINRLIITGLDVEQKSLSFRKGLNLVTGPSDTGKSYIFQCIDFVFGKSKPPKAIKESKGYEDVYLEIEEYNTGSISVLSRKLSKDSKCLYYKNVTFENIHDVNPVKLDPKLSKSENISSLLLNLSGFKLPIKINKNQSCEKVNFSFRNLVNYNLIKEDVLILERSPMYTGSHTDRTRDLNTFKFLLTGIDDSATEKKEKKEVWSAKKAANIQLLQELLDKEEEKYEQLKIKKEQFYTNRLKSEIQFNLSNIQEEIIILNDELSKKSANKSEIQLDIKYNKNLKYKFSLLKDQYLSDIERLKFVDEGSFLMNQLKVSSCPHCGEGLAQLECQHHLNNDINNINQACDYEIKKIYANLSELEKSEQTATEVIESLQQQELKIIDVIKETKNRLNHVLQPQLNKLVEEWDKILQFEILASDITSIEKQISHLQQLISEITSKKHVQPSTDSKDIVDKVNKSLFPKLLEITLKKFLFNEERALPIKFYMNDDFELDFKIDDKTRGSYGKGYRSLLASGFYVTLLSYCSEKDLPHPNLLILDSPVTSFTDLKVHEKLPQAVQNHFFEYLADNFKHKQVIIMENESVLPDLAQRINVIEFTKDPNKGRYGLF